MGVPYIECEVFGLQGSEKLNFLIDSGSNYSVLPLSVWKRLGLVGKRPVQVSLADGRILPREVSECKIQLKDRDVHTPVILGEEDDEPLLGVVTLEQMGLVLNPLKRTLEPMLVRM